MLNDLRYALRSLVKNPVFTLSAVVTIALGIGAATVSFTVLNALLLRPLPFIQNQDRMLWVNEAIPSRDIASTDIVYADFLIWRERAQTLESIWLYNSRTVVLRGQNQPERIQGAGISANAFQAMGVQPILGRNFLPAEEKPEAPPVALLGYGLWQRLFGSDASIVGKTVALNGQPTTIVGVMPDGWRYPETADLWVPLQITGHAAEHGFFNYNGHAMLKPGVTLAQARTELEGIAAGIARDFPATNTGLTVTLRPVREEAAEDMARYTVLLFGAVMFVFLIACANVANLLLARASGRTKEVALRLALGASRGRLVRQFLTESLLLGLAGAVAGLLTAFWGRDLLLATIPVEIPFWLRFEFSPAVFAFVLTLSLVATLLCGLFPALQVSRQDLQEGLKTADRSSTGGPAGQRLRQGLVVLEIGLALVLLVSAGLMVRSFLAVGQVRPGFEAENVLTFRLGFPPSANEDPETFRRFFRELLPKLSALPGVESAAATSVLPALGQGGFLPIHVEGQPEPKTIQEAPGALHRTVTSDLFSTLRVPRRAGRFFDARDDAAHPAVAIIDEEFARQFFPSVDPIGKRFRQVKNAGEAPRWLEVVGVVGNVRRWLDRDQAVPTVYRPYEQDSLNFMSVTLRVHDDPGAIGQAARATVLSVNPDIPIYNLATLTQSLQQAVWTRRTFGWLFTVFAGIALFLASVGIYGVMAYSVAMRTREIGVRMALGARPGEVQRLILRNAFGLVVIGLAGGFVIAFFVTRLLDGSLYGIAAHDPATFAGVALMITGVALAACWLPARRAARVDPLVALRSE
jgi:putative ABC transport system permease protein